MNTYDKLKQAMIERYSVEAYANDEGTKNMFSLFASADKLSDQAKREFVKYFNYEFSRRGQIYLGGKRSAQYNCPHLIEEAESCGIAVIMR